MGLFLEDRARQWYGAEPGHACRGSGIHEGVPPFPSLVGHLRQRAMPSEHTPVTWGIRIAHTERLASITANVESTGTHFKIRHSLFDTLRFKSRLHHRFEPSDFEFVSYFAFRISCFPSGWLHRDERPQSKTATFFLSQPSIREPGQRRVEIHKHTQIDSPVASDNVVTERIRVDHSVACNHGKQQTMLGEMLR